METNSSDISHDFDADVEEYNANMATQLGADYEKFARYKVDLLNYLVKEDFSDILNYGCGIGNDMPYFKKYYSKARLYGCDISKRTVEYAAKMQPDVFYFQSDTPEKIYNQNVKWDLVFLAGVIHHIPPSERFIWLNAIAENVKMGGYICVFEHNVINPMTRKIVTHPIEDPPLDKIEWMLKLKELEQMLINSDRGMNAYWKGYTLFYPFKRTERTTKIETILKWCPLGAQQCVIVKKEY